MKALLLGLVVVVVSGCAVYPAPYGGGAYRYSAPSRAYYPNPPPRVHDQDHDGVPDRRDRDRDGDGVADRWDAKPNDSRRR